MVRGEGVVWFTSQNKEGRGEGAIAGGRNLPGCRKLSLRLVQPRGAGQWGDNLRYGRDVRRRD